MKIFIQVFATNRCQGINYSAEIDVFDPKPHVQLSMVSGFCCAVKKHFRLRVKATQRAGRVIARCLPRSQISMLAGKESSQRIGGW
jgi:hypothetical protein